MNKRAIGRKPNILIMDDEPDNLRVLTEIMTESGYYVRPVTTSKQAIFASQAIPPDLILLDILMPPGMDGYQVCQELKAHPKTQDIPIIFLSAMTEAESIIKGLELGAEDYIRKPFNKTEVLLRIKNHLELSFSKKTIEEKNHKQKELIHVLCHDLMNSIGAVCSILDAINIDDESNSLYLDLIKKATHNGIEIINLVRQMSSLEDGKMILNLASYSLKALIDESLAILEDKFIKKSIQAIVDIDDNIYVRVENVSFINSVIINLLTNALKFSFENSSIVRTVFVTH